MFSYQSLQFMNPYHYLYVVDIIIQSPNMNQIVTETQLRFLIKLTIIKLSEYNENGLTDQELRKPLSFNETTESAIIRILKMNIKNDYQHLIMMTFVGDLISIMMVLPDASKLLLAKMETLLDEKVLQLIRYSTLSKEVKNYYYLKKMQTIRLVFEHHLSFPETNIPFFSNLYHLLRNCQTTDSNTTKEHYKLTFVNIHKHIITHCKNPEVLDFVFNNLISDSLKAIQQFKKEEAQGMRILDSRLLSMLIYLGQSKITHKQLVQAGYLLVKASNIDNSYINGLILSVGEAVLNLLTNIQSPLTIIIIHHIIINPLVKYLMKPTNNSLSIFLLLEQLSHIFKNKRLLFSVIRQSDINFYAQPLIQKILTQLHLFVDEEEKKSSQDSNIKSVKQCLKSIMTSVKNILDHKKDDKLCEENLKMYKFYKLKQKTYGQLVDKFNNEPKSLVKGDVLSDYRLDLLAHFLRKSSKINVQKMIQCLGQPNQNSAKLLSAYLQTFNFKKFSIEQCLRVMLSNFFLIGESQQINRVSEQLSKYLYENDKEKYHHPDNVYMFCSALLILNTDLHNPQNEKKMNEADWLKMCSIIKGMTEEQLLIIFENISKNKIQNFRDLSHLHNMNYTCFMYNFYTEKDLWKLSYVDPELKVLQSNNQLFKNMSYQFLETILVGKQITKLDKLIEVWEYKEDVYECEILQIVKTLASRGQHDVPEKAVDRILERVDLNNQEVKIKSLSYYWLLAKIIIQHPETINTQVICHIINSTYTMRLHLEDDLCCRELIKVRRIKDSIKWYKSKSIKKKGSILDIFANFLGDKQSSDEEGPIHSNIKKPIAFKKLGAELYQILGINKQSRKQAIKYFLSKIRDEKNKIPVGQFIFTLYVVFDLVFLAESIESVRLIQILLQQILLLEDSALGKRLHELQRRKQKKYDLIIFLTKYYTLKILLQNPFQQIKSAGLVEAALSIIPECNMDLLREFIIKIQSLKLVTGTRDQHKKNEIIDRVWLGIIKNIKDNNYQQQFKDILQGAAIQAVCKEIVTQMVVHIESFSRQKATLNNQIKQKKQQYSPDQQKQPINQQIDKKIIDNSLLQKQQKQQKQEKQQKQQKQQKLGQEQSEAISRASLIESEQNEIKQNEPKQDHSQLINQTIKQMNSQKQNKIQQVSGGQSCINQNIDPVKQESSKENILQSALEDISKPIQQVIEGQHLQNPNANNIEIVKLSENIKDQIVNQSEINEQKTEQISDSTLKQQIEQQIPSNPFENFHNNFQSKNSILSEQQMLKAEEEQLNKLIGQFSDQHLQKFGLPIYML